MRESELVTLMGVERIAVCTCINLCRKKTTRGKVTWDSFNKHIYRICFTAIKQIKKKKKNLTERDNIVTRNLKYLLYNTFHSSSHRSFTV